MKKLLPLLSALFALASCSHDADYVLDRSGPGSLSLQEVQDCFETSRSYFKTKGFPEDSLLSNFFYRGSFEPIWVDAELSHDSVLSWMDIPVEDDSDFDYFAAAYDSHGFYWTRCHHSVTVMKNRETGAMSYYNHFYVPGRKMVDKYGTEDYDGQLFHAFLTNGYMDDYEGMEFFTNMKGEVVVFNRYFEGELYEHMYVKDGRNDTYGYMKWALNCYLGRMFRIRKDAASHVHTKAAQENAVFSRCPDCCSTDLIELSNGGYLCMECGWMYGGVLDGSYVEGSWPSGDDDSDEPYTPTQDTEPGNGGSNANHHGMAGGTDTNNYRGFNIDPDFDRYIKPTFDELLDDCAGGKLINALREQNISFTKVSDYSTQVHFKIAWNRVKKPNGDVVYESRHRIEYNLTRVIDHSVLFEELVHGIQVMNGYYSLDIALNCEIEAKMAAYIYMKKNDKTDLFIQTESTNTSGWDISFGGYLDYPSNNGYQNLIDFITEDGRYSDASIYYDNPYYHKMSNLYLIFEGCDDYLSYQEKIHSISH